MFLINCEIGLHLSWTKGCVLVQHHNITGVNFRSKFYVPMVTLSKNYNMFSEHFKQGFKRTLSWNKYRSEMTTQPNNNNLD